MLGEVGHEIASFPALLWEGKESLVTTACACAKISVHYPWTTCHMIVYYTSQAQKSPSPGARKVSCYRLVIVSRRFK
jgi:hypothetical protein